MNILKKLYSSNLDKKKRIKVLSKAKYSQFGAAYRLLEDWSQNEKYTEL